MQDTPTTLETMSPRARWGLCLFCVALGLYPILLATGVVEPDPGQLHAPRWVVAVAGSIFVVLGLYLPFSGSKFSNNLFGALICLSFAAIGGWVALYAEPGSITGGIPFAPKGLNHLLGRGMFGFGALISLAMAVYALRLAARALREDTESSPT